MAFDADGVPFILEKACDGYLPSYWCCPRHTKCGTHCSCLSVILDLSVVLSGITILFVLVCGLFCCIGSIPIKYGQPTDPAVTIGPLQTSFQPDGISRCLETTRQRIENFNIGRLETERFIMDIPLRNSTALTGRQLAGSNHFGNRVAVTTSVEQTPGLPPAYEELVRQNSITITMEQHSLLASPPTYEDFMQRNNERARYNIHDF